ncbi:recombinase family protein [Pacificispira sp.]|uniref:recombinase family protein n=1 Tax=Pacificispira sp. TaxID=2888761 RepID=UPI003B52DCFC
MEQEKTFVAYYRVSTDRQGRSGLGLEAQRESVERYLSACGGDLLNSFIEVESGSKKQRPELESALAECRRKKATLIIAKLDRLARNVHFISGLMESRVEFVAADNPHANRLMVHMLAAFAEHEREMISQRTKAALAAAKARGVQLGATGKDRARENKEVAKQQAEELRPVIEELVSGGIVSFSALSRALNEKGIPSSKNGSWHPKTVSRLCNRLQVQFGGLE